MLKKSISNLIGVSVELVILENLKTIILGLIVLQKKNIYLPLSSVGEAKKIHI